MNYKFTAFNKIQLDGEELYDVTSDTCQLSEPRKGFIWSANFPGFKG